MTHDQKVTLYPEQSVDPATNTIQVTPELISNLLSDYIFGATRSNDHTEGDIRLRVDYDDLKALLILSGKEVHEIRRGVDL